MNLAVRVESLSKKYKIGVLKDRHDTLRDQIAHAVKSWFSHNGHRVSQPLTLKGQFSTLNAERSDTIWALKDISFEIKHGEVVGFIGRNGAGKSTLLKILSRITEPTSGRVEIHGRVASLLEVGTGFHAELTGRENIYLNGAILGMKKCEIDGKFDEIVAFSEIEKFIDTPVKRYSSGMYVRLAFAVAAHLQPEILIVDEVLAVGDAAFQRKCLGKMADAANAGRTVLFVSHNTSAIMNLCNRGVFLESGKVCLDGEIDAVVREYVGRTLGTLSEDLLSRRDRQGQGKVRFVSLRFEDNEGTVVRQGVSGNPLAIVLQYTSEDSRPLENCRVSIAVHDHFGHVFFNCSTDLTVKESVTLLPRGSVKCTIARLPLSRSDYVVSVYIEVNRIVEDWIDNATILSVIDGDFYGTGRLYPPGWEGKGVLLNHEWSLH